MSTKYHDDLFLKPIMNVVNLEPMLEDSCLYLVEDFNYIDKY